MELKTGLNITKMKAGFKYDYAEVLTEIFKSYNIFITKDGVFVDMETRKYIRDNHIKCMLRIDYIKSGHGLLTGKFLVSIIERYIIGLKDAAAELADVGETEYTGYYEVADTYMK
jgi:hypothetical protein